MCSFQPATLTTERLSLREPMPRDAGALAALGAAAQALVPANPFDEARKAFVIEHPLHGVIGIVGFKPKGRYSELDVWVARAHRGNGYATEAVRAALAWAREGWGRKVVLSGHAEGSEASAGLLIKAGFLYTGDVEHRPAPTRMMVWLA
jgi:RimJ/RimL family protein N-acetyltransferase